MHCHNNSSVVFGTRSSNAVRLLLLSIALLTTLIAAPRSYASWSSLASTGTATGIGSPSCAHISSENVACAVMSEKSAMMVNEYNDGKWGTWKSLTGTITSAPSCTGDGGGKVFCAATGVTGPLAVSILSGTTWSTPATVSAALYSAPSCAEYLTGEVLCDARS